MKNSKVILAMIAVLLGNMASIQAMGRLPRLVAQKVATKRVSAYPMINVPGEDGHTLLYNAIKNRSPEDKAHIKSLWSKGAYLNNRDIYMLGYAGYLASLLNTSHANPSAVNMIKTYRTFMTKNTALKLNEKAAKGKITPSQHDERLALRGIIENVYKNAVSEGLWAAREQERQLRKLAKRTSE